MRAQLIDAPPPPSPEQRDQLPVVREHLLDARSVLLVHWHAVTVFRGSSTCVAIHDIVGARP